MLDARSKYSSAHWFSHAPVLADSECAPMSSATTACICHSRLLPLSCLFLELYHDGVLLQLPLNVLSWLFAGLWWEALVCQCSLFLTLFLLLSACSKSQGRTLLSLLAQPFVMRLMQL